MPTTEESLKLLDERMSNVEFAHLQEAHLIATLQEKVTALEQAATSLGADRDDVKKRLDAVEKAPPIAEKKLDAMEKRLHIVEGALGSQGLKEAKTHPHK